MIDRTEILYHKNDIKSWRSLAGSLAVLAAAVAAGQVQVTVNGNPPFCDNVILDLEVSGLACAPANPAQWTLHNTWTGVTTGPSMSQTTTPCVLGGNYGPGCWDVTVQLPGEQPYVFPALFCVEHVEAAFTVSDSLICAGECVTIADASNSVVSPVSQWVWNGLTCPGVSGGQPTFNCCLDAGIYLPQLTVWAGGCPAAVTGGTAITVDDEHPTALITPATILDCPGPMAIELNSSGSLGGPFAGTAWTVTDANGDPTGCSGTSGTLSCNLPTGDYNACLTVDNMAGCSDSTCIPITIFDEAAVNISVESSPTCAGVCVHLLASPMPAGPQAITWAVTDGGGNTLPPPAPELDVPCYTFPYPGSFTVSCTATYSGTCSASATTTVQVFDPLIAEFAIGAGIAEDTTACSTPFCLDFINQSVGAGSLTYAWLVNGVAVSTGTDLSHCFTSTSTLTLEVTNEMGCTASRTITVTIDPLELELTGVPSGTCAGQSITPGYDLTAIPGESITAYAWTFPGGTPTSSTVPSPIVSYAGTGTYQLCLEVTTTNGCTASACEDILISPALDAGFGPTPQYLCAAAGVQLQAVDPDGTWYEWHFGDGLTVATTGPTVNYMYQSIGCFDVALTVSNMGCLAMDTIEDAVCVWGPVALFDVEQACSTPYLASFQDNSIAADTLCWDFGDNTGVLCGAAADPAVSSPTHVYTAEGTYTVCLTASADTSDCPYTTCRTIYIDEPSANLTFGPVTGCPPLCVSFEPQNEPYVIAWDVDFGNGVTLDADAGPVPPSWMDDPLSVFEFWDGTFDNTALGSWNAPFPDDPFITCVDYQSADTYTIAASATNINGCTADTTYVDAIVINIAPDFATFSTDVTDACGPFCVQMTPDYALDGQSWSYSTVPGGTWTSFNAPLLCLPDAPAFLEVRLQGQQGACSDEQIQVVPIPVMEQAAFTVNDTTPCAGQTVSFSTTGNAPQWTIDGLVGPGGPVLDLVLASGTHEVCLIIQDPQYGCPDTLCRIVDAFTPDPSTEVAVTQVGCNYQVTTCPTNAGPPGTSITYTLHEIYPDAGVQIVLPTNPVTLCATSTLLPHGVYDLVVEVHGPGNWSDCVASDTIPDVLNLGNVLGPWTWSPVDSVNCPPYCVQFAVFDTMETGYTYVWDFGDCSPSASGPVVEHCYTTECNVPPPNTFNPSLQVVFPNGCGPFFFGDSITLLPYSVAASPVPPFCADTCANVVFSPDDPAFSIHTLDLAPSADVLPGPQWTFDLCPSVPTNYTATATYFQCVDTVAFEAVVHPVPTASFTSADACQYDTVTYTDNSALPWNSGNDAIASWDWLFGDGSTSDDQHPQHTWTAWGTFTDQLTVTSTFGCSDVATQDITVHPAPVNSMAFSPNCFGESTIVQSVSTIPAGSIESTWWELEAALIPYSGTVITHVFSASPPFFHPIILHTLSDQGCATTLADSVEIWPRPQAAFVTSAEVLCLNGSATLTSTSSIPEPYTLAASQWSLNGGSLANGETITIPFSDTGDYDVGLIVTSANGCSDTLLMPGLITVHPLPVAGFFADPPQVPVYDGTIQFTDTSYDAVQWHYSFGDGISDNDPDPNHGYVTFGTYDVMQVVTNLYNCTDTAHVPVVIQPDVLVHVPNAFTPDGDGVNDLFLPVLHGFGIRAYRLSIWDRWGECIFSSDQPGTAWNGTYGGRSVRDGVYAWRIELSAADIVGGRRMDGHVTLVR